MTLPTNIRLGWKASQAQTLKLTMVCLGWGANPGSFSLFLFILSRFTPELQKLLSRSLTLAADICLGTFPGVVFPTTSRITFRVVLPVAKLQGYVC